MVKKTSQKLTTPAKYWNQVQTQTHFQIADLLNRTLPLPNLRKEENLDLAKDADYCTLVTEWKNNYSQTNPLPNSEILAEEITYEYLLLVVKSILKNLSNFGCHQPEYFTNLTN